MGEGGAFLLTLQLFLAVTSTGSAEQIAVASLWSYDIYRDYINPKATGKQIILHSRVGVCAYSVLSGVFAVILLRLDISLGWGEWSARVLRSCPSAARRTVLDPARLTCALCHLLCCRSVPLHGHRHRRCRVPHGVLHYLEQGAASVVVLGRAHDFVPRTLCAHVVLTPAQVSGKAAIIASCIGMPLAVMTWLITAAQLNDGEISIATTGQDYPMLAGNLVALCIGAIVTTVLSYIW